MSLQEPIDSSFVDVFFLKAIRKSTLAVITIVIILAAVGATVYLTRRMVTPSFSFAPSTFVAMQSANFTFTVYGLESNGVATIYFGDGQEANTTSTLTHTYQDSGRYLVGAEEFVGGQPVASTFDALETIQVTPQVNPSLAPSISMPTVAFDVTRNPTVPVVQMGVACRAGVLVRWFSKATFWNEYHNHPIRLEFW